ncbi:MAG: O-antigen ligase [Polaribacter sp.]|jgi:O-antigen ligase
MEVISRTFMNVLQQNKYYNISEIFLILVLATLPLGGHALNSNAVILFFLVSLTNYIVNKPTFKFNRISILLIIFYAVCLLSLFWTENLENTKIGLVRFLSYLALPLAFVLNSNKPFNNEKIIGIFSKLLVFYGVYCVFIAAINCIQNGDISYLFYHKLSNNLGDLNAIYLSVFVSLGISFFLGKKEKSKVEISYLIFLGLFLMLLSSKLIISITFIVALLYFFKRKKYKKVKWKDFFFISGIIILFLFASSNLLKRVKVEFEKTKINEVLDTKDFGHVYLWTGVALRLFQTKAFTEILKEQRKILFGFGLNNSQKSLNDKYKEYNLYPGFMNYNYHNQYLQVFAELGVVGLGILLMILFSVLKDAIILKNYFLLSFIILILVVCITESFLWRQRGMVFFIIISLLFSKRKKFSV